MGRLAIARTSLLAVLTLGLWLGFGEALAFDDTPGVLDPAGRSALDLTTHHSVVVDGESPGAGFAQTRNALPARWWRASSAMSARGSTSPSHVQMASTPGASPEFQTSTDDSVLYAYAVCFTADE